MKNNQCFYCEIRGHQVKDCRKKAADRHPFNGRCADNPGKNEPPPPIHNRASIDTPKIAPSAEEMADFVKNNMDYFSKDTKLGFINSLMPKDFQTAQN